MGFGVCPAKGIKTVMSLVIVSVVSKYSERNFAFELFVLDVVRLGDGGGQKPLSCGQEKESKNN